MQLAPGHATSSHSVLNRLAAPVVLIAEQNDLPEAVAAAVRSLPDPSNHAPHVLVRAEPDAAAAAAGQAAKKLDQHLQHAQLRCPNIGWFSQVR